MKKKLFFSLIIFSLSLLNATKYSGEIFQLGAGIKNFAIGNCGLTDNNSFATAFWNSALLSSANEDKFELLHAEEFMGLLKYDTASAIFGSKNKFSIMMPGKKVIKKSRPNISNVRISGRRRSKTDTDF